MMEGEDMNFGSQNFRFKTLTAVYGPEKSFLAALTLKTSDSEILKAITFFYLFFSKKICVIILTLRTAQICPPRHFYRFFSRDFSFFYTSVIPY